MFRLSNNLFKKIISIITMIFIVLNFMYLYNNIKILILNFDKNSSVFNVLLNIIIIFIFLIFIFSFCEVTFISRKIIIFKGKIYYGKSISINKDNILLKGKGETKIIKKYK